MTISSEFSLHIHKTLGDWQRPDLYTIVLWQELSVLRIGYSRLIDDALARPLEETSKVAKLSGTKGYSDTRDPMFRGYQGSPGPAMQCPIMRIMLNS